jgi:hypothetical protein
MTSTTVALRRAVAALTDRVLALEKRIAGGEDCYDRLIAATTALAAAVTALHAHDAERLLTTKELGERYSLGRKTAARRAKNGDPPVTPVKVGARLRWKSAS